jgi:hypothetical protein
VDRLFGVLHCSQTLGGRISGDVYGPPIGANAWVGTSQEGQKTESGVAETAVDLNDKKNRSDLRFPSKLTQSGYP